MVKRGLTNKELLKVIEENNTKTKRFSIGAMGITFMAISLTMFLALDIIPDWGKIFIGFFYFITGIMLVVLPDKWIMRNNKRKKK